MPALKPTDIYGRIDWLGVVPARDLALASRPRESLMLNFDGPEGEDHGGLTRPSCSRVASQYRRGTQIRNTRQLSVVGAEELVEVAKSIGLEAFDPSWIGATMVISGIPDFTHLPPSSRLQIAEGATIVVDMENRPCVLPAPVIEADAPGHGKAFKAAAKGRRGVTAWVEREGAVRIGDVVRLHIPDQRGWQGG
ncbi:MOSC domain-containing protein [Jannaschia pohangensis]|uniref:MOSC domain-containing protein n=1 Tax=Jannaschia pohangensis TaxID=390807 RepID=A0A1I3LYY3_9RHOB|nr:MOSC domain-containing protein [Jannaschia pohangensis]SFI89974.1 MOSC domain-containing protein [Jannaschia pohangensis]